VKLGQFDRARGLIEKYRIRKWTFDAALANIASCMENRDRDRFNEVLKSE
jgi:hypothetical protein